MFASRGSHLAIFARQLASMMSSGLLLVAVLENLGRETPNRRLRAAVREVARRVTSGSELPDALESYPRLFDGVFIGLVRSGMESGRLAGALLHVADYLERSQQLSRRVVSATAYPAFVLLTFFGVAGAMVFFVLPQFAAIFRTTNRPLPGPTLFLIGLGDGLRDNVAQIGAAAAVLVIAACVVVATRSGRVFWDRVKLALPVLGPVWKLAAVARFSRTLAVQVGNHVSVVRALRLAAAASGNAHIGQLVHGIANDIEMGASISDAFKERALFSGIVLQMIAAGEEAGRLDELLLSAATYYESLLMQRVEAVTSLINPVLTAVLGAAVAGMMIAAYLPVFDMPDAMQ